MKKRINVAAIQMDCHPCQKQRNLQHAETMIREAVSHGAMLVLLPELTPSGYRLTEELWEQAEPLNGAITQWLCALAGELQAYIGMTFLEAEGENFFNTFVLASPSGTLYPSIRKFPPAGPEAFFFRTGDGPHYFDTEIGRIGVGICYENFLHSRHTEFFAAKVDLILQPFSAPTPHARFPLRPLDVRISGAALREQPSMTARALGVPVVMANRCGPFVSSMPGRLPAWNSSFSGLSTVVDGDGVVKGQLAVEEGVVVAEVTLDSTRKTKVPPVPFGIWAMPVPWWYVLLPWIGLRGEKHYQRNEARKVAALKLLHSKEG